MTTPTCLGRQKSMLHESQDAQFILVLKHARLREIKPFEVLNAGTSQGIPRDIQVLYPEIHWAQPGNLLPTNRVCSARKSPVLPWTGIAETFPIISACATDISRRLTSILQKCTYCASAVLAKVTCKMVAH